MVKCCDCGLLATRGDGTDEPWEATPEIRASGWHNTIRWSGVFGGSAIANFFCYVASKSFPPLPPDEPNEVRNVALVKQINAEIECPLWRPYLPGRTPKAHEDMSILEQVKAENAAAREAAHEVERLERKTDREAAERRHKDTLANASYTRWIAVGSLIVAIAALVASFFVKH